MANNLPFQSYELIFAQQLGVDLDERFATELIKLAMVGMNSLPNGWELNFTETDGGQVVYFYNSNDNWSTWSHPNERLYIQMIENKRKELIRKIPLADTADNFAGIPTGVANINVYTKTRPNNHIDNNDVMDPIDDTVQEQPVQLPILTESSLQQHNLLTSSSSQHVGSGNDKTVTRPGQVDGDEYGDDMFFTGIFSDDDESKGVLSDGIAAIGIDQQDNSYEEKRHDWHENKNNNHTTRRGEAHSHSFSNHNAHIHNGPMSTFLHYDAGINAALPPLSEENSQYFDLTASSVFSGHTSSLVYQADVNSLFDNSLNHIETKNNDDDHDITTFLHPLQPRSSCNTDNNTETNDDGTKPSGKRNTKPPISVTASAKTKARSAALISEAKQRAQQRQSSDNSLINDNDSVNSYISDNSDTYNKSMFGAVRSKFASLYSTAITKANALSALTSTVLQKAAKKQIIYNDGTDGNGMNACDVDETVAPNIPSEVFIIEEIPTEVVDECTHEISNIINDDFNKEKGIATNNIIPVAGAYHNTDTRDTAKSPVGSDTSGLESFDFVDKMFADILLTPQGTRRKSEIERDQKLTHTEAENTTEKPETAPSVKSITMDGESWLTPVLVESSTIGTDMADPIVLLSPQNYTKHINHFPSAANKLLIDDLWGSSDDIDGNKSDDVTAVSPHGGPSTEHLSEKTDTAEGSTIGTGAGLRTAAESQELLMMTAQDRDAGFDEFEGVSSEYFHIPDHSLFSSKVSLCDLAASNRDHHEYDNDRETVFTFVPSVAPGSPIVTKSSNDPSLIMQPFSASPKASEETKLLAVKDEIGKKTPVLVDLDTDYSSLSLFDFADQSRKVFDTTTAQSSPVNLSHKAQFTSPRHTNSMHNTVTTNVDCVEMMKAHKLSVFNFAEPCEHLTQTETQTKKQTLSQTSDPIVNINESVFRFPSMRSSQAHTLSNSPEQPLPNKTQLIPLKVNASATAITDTVTGSILGVTPEISPLSMASTATSTVVSSPTNKPNTSQPQPQPQQQQSSPTQKSQLKSMLSFISKNATKFDVDVADYLGSEKKPYQQITTIHDIPSSIVQATALQGIAPTTTARQHGGDILSHFHSLFKPSTAELLSLEASEMQQASRNNDKHKRDRTSGRKERKVVTKSGSTRNDNKVHNPSPLSPIVGFISATDLLQKSHDVSGKGLHNELSMLVYYNNVSGGGGGGRGRNGRHNPTAPGSDEDSENDDVDGGKTSKIQWYTVPNKYYATYKKATQAKEALNQILATKIEQMFVSHSRRHSQSLPELKPKGGKNSNFLSLTNHEHSEFTAINSNSSNSSGGADNNRPSRKETSNNYSTQPRHTTKESSGTENLNYQLEIRRDNVRMQWKLECNNSSIIRIIQKHYESEQLAAELQSLSLSGLPPPVAGVVAQSVKSRAHSHNGKVTKVRSSNAVKHVRKRQTSLTNSGDRNDAVSKASSAVRLPALSVVQPKPSVTGKRRNK